MLEFDIINKKAPQDLSFTCSSHLLRQLMLHFLFLLILGANIFTIIIIILSYPFLLFLVIFFTEKTYYLFSLDNRTMYGSLFCLRNLAHFLFFFHK